MLFPWFWTKFSLLYIENICFKQHSYASNTMCFLYEYVFLYTEKYFPMVLMVIISDCLSFTSLACLFVFRICTVNKNDYAFKFFVDSTYRNFRLRNLHVNGYSQDLFKRVLNHMCHLNCNFGKGTIHLKYLLCVNKDDASSIDKDKSRFVIILVHCSHVTATVRT